MNYRIAWMVGLSALCMAEITMAGPQDASPRGDCWNSYAECNEPKKSDGARTRPSPRRGQPEVYSVSPRPTSSMDVKRDLLGLHIGWTEEETNNLLKEKGKCVEYSQESNVLRCVMENDAKLIIAFTTRVQPSLVKLIEYTYHSGATPEKMISLISAQFKVRPKKSDWSEEIRAASISKKIWVPPVTTTTGWFHAPGYYTWVAEGTICNWDLDEADLQLTLDYRLPYRYSLTLSSRKIDRAELQALEQSRPNDQNLSPKF